MALVALANEGNFLHVFDFRVKPGTGEEFIALFNKFDYSDENPFHKSAAQVKDGVLCRDAKDPDHFYLIGEWASIEAHAELGKYVGTQMKPDYLRLLDSPFMPTYAQVVSSTPQDVLDRAQGERAETAR